MMRKWIMIIVVVLFMGLTFSPVNAIDSPAGPAPNSGDGIPDGSGFPEPPSPGPAGPQGK